MKYGILALLGDECVESVAEEVSAVHTAVAVEYAEIGGFFPICGVLGFGKIQYNGHPVLVVLSDRSLVRRGGIGANSSMSVFRMFRGFEMRDRHQHLRQRRMFIFLASDTSFFNLETFGLYEHFFSDNLIDVSHRRFGFGPRLVFVMFYIGI